MINIVYYSVYVAHIIETVGLSGVIYENTAVSVVT